MIHYTVRRVHPHRHFISFEVHFPANGKAELEVRLAAWRPGRYELGNFSKNIRAWQAHSPNGTPLKSRKQSKDTWIVECNGLEEVVVRYEYYASELNAGSSFLDDDQLYINPVNCFLYLPNDHSAYRVHFDLPADYQIACGMEADGQHTLIAQNFDELADCPLIASATLRKMHYELAGTHYHIWWQGEVLLDESRMLSEFKAFTHEHIRIFGDIPCREYHFLFHFPPFFVRHGVEHRNSTVIAMGPASEFQFERSYKDLLGISCHELFHTWNIKCIRPAEMLPYDFSKENYSRLGYVAEGVTTYYGDFLLWRTNSLSEADWLGILEETIKTHFTNPGRFNHSVADSSFDTWLDGYQSGIPWRKVSIYNEGCLLAWICDVFVLYHSGGLRSLDDVMRKLYVEFGKKNIGYTEQDYRRLIEEVAGADAGSIFDGLVNGQEDYTPFLDECLERIGCKLERTAVGKWSEALLGMGVDEAGGRATVNSVIPLSPADTAGLWNGDEIIAVNGVTPYKNFQALLRMHAGTAMKLTFTRKGKIRETEIREDGREYAFEYHIVPLDDPTKSQLALRERWKVR
jgi:predicted metalloprotease with PDZ domain